MKEVAELFKTGLVAAFPNTGCRDGLTMSHERASQIWRTAKSLIRLKATIGFFSEGNRFIHNA